MTQLVAELRQRIAEAREGGGAKYVQRHREQGKLPVRERIARLDRSRLAVSRVVAACRLRRVRRRHARRGHRHRHRPRVRPRRHHHRQRRDGEGGHVLSGHREEASPRAADRAREPAAVSVSCRFRRRVPAAAGRCVSRSRTLRPHLLQSGAPVGRAHRAGRRGDGLVHRRRRVRAGDVGRDDHREGHGNHFSRRPAAREGGDRRGSDGAGSRRRGRAHAALGRCGLSR